MNGSIMISIAGLLNRDETVVSVQFLHRQPDGELAFHELLFGTRLAQDITETMSIEQWSLAHISNITDWIRQQLAMRIEQGSKTLIGDLPKDK